MTSESQLIPTSIPWLTGLPLPAHWAESKVKHLVASMRAGDAITAEHIEPTGQFPVYGGNGKRGYTEQRTHSGTYVLVGRQGALCGNVHLVEGDFWASEHAIVIAPSPGVDERWLANVLTVMDLGQYSQTAAQPGIGTSQIAALALPVPPVREQRAIADYIDSEASKIDALIAEQRGLIRVLKERRIALIARLVARGLDQSASLVDSGADWLGQVPAHWEVKRLKFSVASTQVGVWGSEPLGDDDDVLCVRVADFDRPRLRVSDEVPTVRSVKASDRLPRLLQPGDLLLEKSGGTAINPVGFVGVFEGTDRLAVSSNFLTRLRAARGQHPRYWLYAHAASYSTRLTARSVNQTTGIQNLDQAAYFNELFPFPPFEEQRAIAHSLDDQTEKIDALIAEAEGIVTVAKERRSTLITAAVTGQIDVHGEVA